MEMNAIHYAAPLIAAALPLFHQFRKTKSTNSRKEWLQFAGILMGLLVGLAIVFVDNRQSIRQHADEVSDLNAKHTEIVEKLSEQLSLSEAGANDAASRFEKEHEETRVLVEHCRPGALKKFDAIHANYKRPAKAKVSVDMSVTGFEVRRGDSLVRH